MNKICGIRQSSVLDELNYLKNMGFDKKKETEIWNQFCSSCEITHEKSNDKPLQQKFRSHPERLCSETDASVVSSRRTSVSSKSSDANMNLKRINYVYEQNKAMIQNARKNMTQPRKNVTYQLDLGMGDNSGITPRNEVQDATDQIITYYDSGEKFTEVEDIKREVDFGFPVKESAPSTVNVRKNVVEKSPSVSYRNVVSDSALEKKFRIFVEKSLHTITDIRSLLENGITPADGDEDESRRIVRVKEFSNRFSRNYLYPLTRQLDELVQMSHHNPGFNQKLLSSYQIVLNGLQAYHNHLPSSTGSCSSDRLKSLLTNLVHLCDVHSRAIRHPDDANNDFIDTFRANAELTLQKVEERFGAKSSDTPQQRSKAISAAEKSKTATFNNAVKLKKSGLETRLSMYNVPAGNFRRDPHWKRMMELWAKRRANVKSRYKTATYRHRPPVEKKSPDSLPSKCKLFAKKSSTMLRRTPVTTPVDENDIATMVQMEGGDGKREAVNDNNDKSSEPAVSGDHEGVVVKLLQLVLDNNRRRKEGEVADGDGGDAKVADILEKLKAAGDVEVLRKVLEALGREEEREGGEQLKLRIVRSRGSVGETPRRRKEPTVTVTGEKNAKLICITDENSIIDTENDPKSEDKDSSTEKPMPLKAVSSTETQTVVTSNKKNKSTQKATKPSSFKMKRLPRSSKCLEKLPKDYALSIIQYKLDFHKHCKQNPMYKKGTNVQPWMLMTKISDQLLDDALLGVAKEIELNDIVQQVYDSELQL